MKKRNSAACQDNLRPENKIASLAVLDMENTNLPNHNFNKTKITELCIYGFSVDNLRNGTGEKNCSPLPGAFVLPERPRILHKMTLLFNPRMRIVDVAEKLTGLNNYMLENESHFDNNAANSVLGFIKHLQQPVCLVAHNGWGFDFPILKEQLDKLNVNLPEGTLCCDSLEAFYRIDQSRKYMRTSSNIVDNDQTADVTKLNLIDDKVTLQDGLLERCFHLNGSTMNETRPNINDETKLPENSLNGRIQTDWRALNETTPKRPSSLKNALVKRKIESDEESDVKRSTPARRCLFPSDKQFSPKELPKGEYKLANLYFRKFVSHLNTAHYAETDVKMLMNLILHYGEDFLQYANEKAVPFATVPKVGANIS